VDEDPDPQVEGAEVRTRAEPGATVISISGEVDSQTIPRLGAVVSDGVARAGVQRVVLDLDGVVFFGSAGIAFLVQASSEARAQGVELRLAAADGSRVHRVLEMMGLTRRLAVFPTSECALRGPGLPPGG